MQMVLDSDSDDHRKSRLCNVKCNSCQKRNVHFSRTSFLHKASHGGSILGPYQ